MKNALYSLAALGVALVLATLSVTHYQNYHQAQVKQQQEVVEKAQDTAHKAEVTAAKTKQAYITAYNDLHQECLKGREIYESLSPSVKSKVQAPDCGKRLDGAAVVK